MNVKKLHILFFENVCCVKVILTYSICYIKVKKYMFFCRYSYNKRYDDIIIDYHYHSIVEFFVDNNKYEKYYCVL